MANSGGILLDAMYDPDVIRLDAGVVALAALIIIAAVAAILEIRAVRKRKKDGQDRKS